MNIHQNYTLASRPQTSRVLRGWAVLSRGTFSGAIFLTDVALIVSMSCLTGIAYHLAAYGEPGHISSYAQVGVLRPVFSPYPTYFAANTGCRISSTSKPTAGAPSSFGT